MIIPVLDSYLEAGPFPVMSLRRKPDKPDLSELKTMSARAGAAAVELHAPAAVRDNAAEGANRDTKAHETSARHPRR